MGKDIAGVMEIHPGRGLGDLLFGMTSEDVKKRLGKPDRTDRDEVTREGLMIYHQGALVLRFDLAEPSTLCQIDIVRNYHTISYRGEMVFTLPFSDLVDLLGESEREAEYEIHYYNDIENSLIFIEYPHLGLTMEVDDEHHIAQIMLELPRIA